MPAPRHGRHLLLPAAPACVPAGPPPLPSRGRRRLLQGGAAALLAGGGLPAAWGQASAAAGIAIPIGGGLKADHEAVWRRLVELSGGPGTPWVVLGTASESPLASAESAARQLQLRGAMPTVLPVSPLLKDRPVAEAVRDPALLEPLRRARGVFFTGGSQDRIVDSLAPGGVQSPLLQAIWQLHRSGGVVAGTSAGAAIMSATMFRDAPDVLAVMKGRLREGQELGAGLGFVGPRLFVDQHFLKRGRIGRMLPLMHARGLVQGLGVEENSAASVRGSAVEMLGGKAIYADLAEARHDPALGAFNLRGVRLSLLDRGDQLDLATGGLQPAAHKRAGQLLDPAAPGYKPYYTEAPFHVAMLADGVLSTAMGLLIDASYTEVRGLSFDPRGAAGDPLAALGFEWRLYKPPGAIGWYSEDGGGEDYTVHRLGLDVLPVRIAQPLTTPWAPKA